MRKEPRRAGGNGRRGRWRWVNPLGEPRRAADSLDRHRLDDDRLGAIDEAEAAFVCAFERAPHRRGRRQRNLDRRIGPRIAQLRAAMDFDRLPRDPLPLDLGDRRVRELIGGGADAEKRVDAEGLIEPLRALRGDVGEPHAVGREQRRERMDEDGRDRQRIGDVAGVLAARAAEAIERIARHVVAARDRNRLDRLGHLGDRNGEKSVGDRLRLPPIADIARQSREALAHNFLVERLIAMRAEYFWEQIGDQLARHQVGVGDRERTAAAISCGAGIRAGGSGADTKAGAVEREDRAASSGDGMDLHHRRAHAHACDFGLERALELPIEMSDVGRGAAHVEADDALEPCADPSARHRHHAPGRARQDRVLAGEQSRGREAARRHHEHDARARALNVEIA